MGIEGVAARLAAADATLVGQANATARASAPIRRLVARAATWLAGLELLLMILLAGSGGLRAAARMLAAAGVVYVLSEGLGAAWQRERPFVVVPGVQPLVAHQAERSFPSRHVASGLAMAGVAGAARPRLARVMSLLAWLLGLSRVAAGVHYPSDVLAGAVLGRLIGRLLQA